MDDDERPRLNRRDLIRKGAVRRDGPWPSRQYLTSHGRDAAQILDAAFSEFFDTVELAFDSVHRVKLQPR